MAVKLSGPLRPSRRWRWLAPAALMGAIFYLSHQSAPAGRAITTAESAAAHLAIYALLAALFYWAVSGSANMRAPGARWLAALLAFSLAALYGALDELHQAFVPGRTASEVDFGLDAAGALIGAVVAALLSRLRQRFRRA